MTSELPCETSPIRSRLRTKSTLSQRVTLAVILGSILTLWLAVFPTLSRITDANARLDRFERAGIDVSAMFYTDHPRSLVHASDR